MEIRKVIVTKHAVRNLRSVPDYIVLKLQNWIDAVGADGLRKVREISGYHDEPLKGKRKGQRSIRLSKAYRAIYTIDDSNQIHFVEIIEVNKHDY